MLFDFLVIDLVCVTFLEEEVQWDELLFDDASTRATVLLEIVRVRRGWFRLKPLSSGALDVEEEVVVLFLLFAILNNPMEEF